MPGIESNANEVLGRMAARFQGARDRVMDAAQQKFQEGLNRTASWIQQNELSGQVLHQRSGRLSQSVGHPTVTRSGDVLNGFIGGVWYGKIHEYGGTFTAVRRAKVVARKGGRYPTYWQHSGSHTVTFPERAWLRPGIRQNQEMIKQLLLEGIRSAL
jgi:phage gpG-like protein